MGRLRVLLDRHARPLGPRPSGRFGEQRRPGDRRPAPPRVPARLPRHARLPDRRPACSAVNRADREDRPGRRQSLRSAWWVAPVPTPVSGTTTPVVSAALVACAAEATLSGVDGAYIASSKLVPDGRVRPTAKIVVTVPA